MVAAMGTLVNVRVAAPCSSAFAGRSSVARLSVMSETCEAFGHVVQQQQRQQQ
jgi:hypothetical protein